MSATAPELNSLLGLMSDVRDALHELVGFNSRQISRSGQPFEVAAATTSTELRPANRWRHMVTVTNDSTSAMYVSLGPVATPDTWTVKLAAGDYYEAPAGYTGPVSAAWDTATGQARVTELA